MNSPRLPSGMIRLVRFAVGLQTYCLPVDCCRAIDPATSVPAEMRQRLNSGWVTAPTGAVLGSFAHLLGEQSSPQPEAVLVIDAQPFPFGLTVDSLQGYYDVPAASLLPLPPAAEQSDRRLFEAIVQIDGDPVLVASPHRLAPPGFAVLHHLPPLRLPLRQHVEPQPAERSSGLQFMLFSVLEPEPNRLEISFGVSVSQVLEIVPLPYLSTLPTAPPSVLGYFSWRGVPVVAIDLAMHLGLSQSIYEAGNRFMVVRATHTEGLIAILVGNRATVVDLPLPHRRWTGELPLDARFARGVFDLDGDLLVVPDVDALVSHSVQPAPAAVGHGKPA